MGQNSQQQPDGGGPLQRRFRSWRERGEKAGLVAVDPAMTDVLAEARIVAPTDAAILIEGPSGAGKDMLARDIHRHGARPEGPFVAINCAALPEAMAEALLFGHERGAFTGAAGSAEGLFRAADGGTLFLDEVGELSLATQARLLRALQDHQVLPLGATHPVAFNARIIAATNRSLCAEVEAGRFRADLYWRLAVFPLMVPPLSSRPADILPIAARLLPEAAPCPAESALALLLAHDWPGNVRELANVLNRASIVAGDRAIETADLRLHPPARPQRLGMLVRAQEADAIHAALAGHGGQRRAAAALGISERTLRYKLAAINGQPRRASANARTHEVLQ